MRKEPIGVYVQMPKNFTCKWEVAKLFAICKYVLLKKATDLKIHYATQTFSFVLKPHDNR